METTLSTEETFIEGTDLRQSQEDWGASPGTKDGLNSLSGLCVFPLPVGFQTKLHNPFMEISN